MSTQDYIRDDLATRLTLGRLFGLAHRVWRLWRERRRSRLVPENKESHHA